MHDIASQTKRLALPSHPGCQDKVNLTLMRFFRDLSRYKARKRLYGNAAALMPLLLGKESPIDENLLKKEADAETFTLTKEQLMEYDGKTATTPIYIGVAGMVFDVTAGRKLYGVGGDYNAFAGRDATRALATGCAKQECVVDGVDGLSESELKEIDRWVELYRTSDKYTLVGRLVHDHVEDIAAAAAAHEA